MGIYKVFCMGEASDDNEAGELITAEPLESGQVHVIKNRRWRCEWVDVNCSGEPLANFRICSDPEPQPWLYRLLGK